MTNPTPAPTCDGSGKMPPDDGAEEIGINAATDYFNGVTKLGIANKGYLASVITAAIRAGRAARKPRRRRVQGEGEGVVPQHHQVRDDFACRRRRMVPNCR